MGLMHLVKGCLPTNYLSWRKIGIPPLLTRLFSRLAQRLGRGMTVQRE